MDNKIDILTGDKLIYWQFDELIKNLITLTLDGDRQKEIIGYGAVAEEMAEDFNSYYTILFQNYIDKKLITVDEKKELDFLDNFFNERSENKNTDFWNDDNLNSHPDWILIREIARKILKLLQKDNLTIKIERTIKENKSINEEPLLITSTKTVLVNKEEN